MGRSRPAWDVPRCIWSTLGVVLKTKQALPSRPPMSLLCCAACLHAIVAPARPMLLEGRFFHAEHVPAESLLVAQPVVMAA